MWLRFTSEGQESWYRAEIEAPARLELATGSTPQIPITRHQHRAARRGTRRRRRRFCFSYHWLPADGDRLRHVRRRRARRFRAGRAGRDRGARCATCGRRGRPGEYRLEWDLVQEGRLWFSTEPGAARVMSRAWSCRRCRRATRAARTTAAAGAADGPSRAARAVARRGANVRGASAARRRSRQLPSGLRRATPGCAVGDPRTHSNNMYLEMFAGGGLLVGAGVPAGCVWRAAAGCRARSCVRPRAHAIRRVALGIAAAALAIALHAARRFVPQLRADLRPVLADPWMCRRVRARRGGRLDAHRV